VGTAFAARKECLTAFTELSEEELHRLLISYLTMLVCMSFITPITMQQSRIAQSKRRQKQTRSAVEHGSRWTLSHFLKSLAIADSDARKDRYSLKKLATWYSNRSCTVARAARLEQRLFVAISRL
jgi:hypothetical protein